MLLVLCLGAYLLGSVPVALLLCRWRRGIDIRDYGTGNPGASNVWRNVGRLEGLAVAAGCVGQGAAPVLAARALGYPEPVAVLVGLAAIAGNLWPVWTGFSGGRGVATSLGVLGALWPREVATLVVVLGPGLLVGRAGLAVLAGTVALPALLLQAGEPAGSIGYASAVGLLLVSRRLAGAAAELRRGHPARRVLLDRLLHDRRVGQRLVGLREP